MKQKHILNTELVIKKMKEKKLKQRDIVNSLMVSKQNVSNWVAGKAFPSEENRQKLSKLLGIKYIDLFVR